MSLTNKNRIANLENSWFVVIENNELPHSNILIRVYHEKYAPLDKHFNFNKLTHIVAIVKERKEWFEYIKEGTLYVESKEIDVVGKWIDVFAYNIENLPTHIYNHTDICAYTIYVHSQKRFKDLLDAFDQIPCHHQRLFSIMDLVTYDITRQDASITDRFIHSIPTYCDDLRVRILSQPYMVTYLSGNLGYYAYLRFNDPLCPYIPLLKLIQGRFKYFMLHRKGRKKK